MFDVMRVLELAGLHDSARPGPAYSKPGRPDQYRENPLYWLAHTMRAIHATSSSDSTRSACSALSDLSSTVLAVCRVSSCTMTSPILVLTTTRSPRRTGAAGDTMMTSPSR